MDLYAALAAPAADHPDRPFLVGPAGPTVSYGEAAATTARVAGLLHSLGVGDGDRVVLQAEKSPAAVLAYLGIVRAGAVLVPLNPAYRPDEVAHFAADAEPALAVVPPGGQEPFATVGAAVLTLDAAEQGTWVDAVADAAPADGAHPGDDDLAALVYTSGTTGRPKGAMLTHGNLVSNARTLHALWGFREGDVLLHALPTFHVHGLFVATNTAMLQAATIRFHRRFDAAAVVADLPRSTVFMGVPTMYTRLLAEPALGPKACSAMRLFVSGSAPLLPETFEQFRARTGHTILERYGMSETGMNTSNPYEGERRVGTVGQALPGVEVRVAGEGDRPVPPDTVGEVQVRGPNVSPGYWRRPERRAEHLTADGFFRTGDLGVLSPDGYLTLVGRSKDLVITGGFNVYPKEVELLLDAVPGVVESAVVGVPHADFGEAVTALVVLAPGASLDEAATLAHLREHLAPYKVPKALRVVDDLPRNAMGKVQKNVLRDAWADLYR